MNEDKKIRVLIGKPGLDGHERGAVVLAYGLRDEGFEVIYGGLRQTPEEIANAAIQEDVKVLGLSILSGAHISLTKRVIEKVREQGGSDILFLVGGVIPEEDMSELKKIGVAGVFTSGSSVSDVAKFIRSHIN